MVKYEPVGETMLLVNPRTGDLVALIDDEELKSNPARRKKPFKVELPLGKHEDLRVRTALVRSPLYGKYEPVTIRSSDDTYHLLKESANLPQESMFVVLLDSRNRVIGIQEIAIGTSTFVITGPVQVFQAAIIANASAIIVVHNHPSDVVEQSKQDTDFAYAVQGASDILGIKMLDFIIVGEEQYLSFRDHGIM